MQLFSGILLFLFVLGVMAIAAYQLIAGKPIEPWEYTVITTAIGVALHNMGYSNGYVAANGVAKDTARAVVEAQANILPSSSSTSTTTTTTKGNQEHAS